MTKGKKSPNLNSRQDPNKMRELAFLAIEKELQKLNDRSDLNKENVVEMMRRCGAHNNLLHVAAALNCDKIADCLIKAGADVNSKDACDHTPLHYAAIQGHIRVAKLLIEGGADVNSKDARGRTPLQVAFDRETAKLLIANGAERSCVPAYIIKQSKQEAKDAAFIAVMIATGITPIVLTKTTELPVTIIILATIASMFIIGCIAYKLEFMRSQHELSSELDEMKCNNATTHTQQPVNGQN